MAIKDLPIAVDFQFLILQPRIGFHRASKLLRTVEWSWPCTSTSILEGDPQADDVESSFRYGLLLAGVFVLRSSPT